MSELYIYQNARRNDKKFINSSSFLQRSKAMKHSTFTIRQLALVNGVSDIDIHVNCNLVSHVYRTLSSQ